MVSRRAVRRHMCTTARQSVAESQKAAHWAGEARRARSCSGRNKAGGWAVSGADISFGCVFRVPGLVGRVGLRQHGLQVAAALRVVAAGGKKDGVGGGMFGCVAGCKGDLGGRDEGAAESSSLESRKSFISWCSFAVKAMERRRFVVVEQVTTLITGRMAGDGGISLEGKAEESGAGADGAAVGGSAEVTVVTALQVSVKTLRTGAGCWVRRSWRARRRCSLTRRRFPSDIGIYVNKGRERVTTTNKQQQQKKHKPLMGLG